MCVCQVSSGFNDAPKYSFQKRTKTRRPFFSFFIKRNKKSTPLSVLRTYRLAFDKIEKLLLSDQRKTNEIKKSI